MQAVASYISRRFFVGNCRKFVVSLSYCQRKTFIFKALRRFLSTCRPYYRWRSCLLNWPVCKTVLIWALSGLCPDSALWLWPIIERIRIACQKAYLLTDWTEHEKHASRVRQNIGVHFWDVSFLFDMFWVIEEDEPSLLLRYHDDLKSVRQLTTLQLLQIDNCNPKLCGSGPCYSIATSLHH